MLVPVGRGRRFCRLLYRYPGRSRCCTALPYLRTVNPETENPRIQRTFSVDPHCNTLLGIKWFFGRFVLDKFDLKPSELLGIVSSSSPHLLPRRVLSRGYFQHEDDSRGAFQAKTASRFLVSLRCRLDS